VARGEATSRGPGLPVDGREWCFGAAPDGLLRGSSPAPVDGGQRRACGRWTPSNKRQVGDLLLPFCGEAWLLLAGRGDREMPVAASLHLVGT
jgi:hypothetical protein